jgi:hypothetical protein
LRLLAVVLRLREAGLRFFEAAFFLRFGFFTNNAPVSGAGFFLNLRAMLNSPYVDIELLVFN